MFNVSRGPAGRRPPSFRQSRRHRNNNENEADNNVYSDDIKVVSDVKEADNKDDINTVSNKVMKQLSKLSSIKPPSMKKFKCCCCVS